MITKKGEIYFKEFDEYITPGMSLSSYKKTKIFKRGDKGHLPKTYVTPPIISGNKKIVFVLYFWARSEKIFSSERLSFFNIHDSNISAEKYGSIEEFYERR